MKSESVNEKTNMSIIISKIQRMCFHDGPGIRTTVFLKGCSIHCPWCSNPENIHFYPETYSYKGSDGVYGREYEANELARELLKDRGFWANGGVTFSGGEPFMHADSLLEVLRLLKENGIHIAMETSLFAPIESVEKLVPYIDYLICDVKILDEHNCRAVLGGSLETYVKNVEYAYEKEVIKLFRVPCCDEYTFTEENQKRLLSFFKNKKVPIQVFSVHDLGESKYESLGRCMWRTNPVEKERLLRFCEELREQGNMAEVIEI